MKKTIFSIAFMLFATVALMAQPNPGQNAGGGSVGGAPIGGSAPIGGGIALLISMAAMYGSKKVFDARKKLME